MLSRNWLRIFEMRVYCARLLPAPVIFVSGKRKAGPDAPTVLALVKADLEAENTVSGSGSKSSLGRTLAIECHPTVIVCTSYECVGLMRGQPRRSLHAPPALKTASSSGDGIGTRQATVLSEEQIRQYDVAPYQRLVGCGMPMGSVEVQCVQVETLKPLGERQVGEIWLRGPSVTQGYWGKEELTRDVFGAQLTPLDGQQPSSDAKKVKRRSLPHLGRQAAVHKFNHACRPITHTPTQEPQQPQAQAMNPSLTLHEGSLMDSLLALEARLLRTHPKIIRPTYVR
jgi:acyl-CoA synthetase (AMP-forming)/AMP-acid ligase II